MVNRAAAAQAAGEPGDLRPHVLAHGADLVGGRRVGAQPVPGEADRAERQRHDRLGLLVQARDLKRAAADVEQQQPTRRPAEPAPGGQEGQPRLVLAGQHPDDGPGLRLDPGEHLVAVTRVPDRGRGEREEILHALVLRDLERLRHHLGEPLLTEPGQRIATLQVSSERKLHLVGEGRQRPGPWVSVDDQEMHRVRADVEHPESHG